MSQLGPDGHPTRGGFLPPVPLPRRMWAGGELEFFEALRVGDEMTRTSRISDVTMKTGSTGVLCFVSVEHVITTPRGTAIRERQDIVYRDMTKSAPAAAKPAAAPPSAKHRESHMADEVLLFRYSALTFNGHRIHYDRDYVTKVEGYPGLIFHGPMQAAFLVEFAAKLHGGTAPKKFSYRGVQPLFEGSEFSVNANDTGAGMELWTANSEGEPTMKGNATWWTGLFYRNSALSRKPSKSTSVSVKDATLDLLRAFGIKKVFGNPGSTELPFLSDWPDDIDYVLGLQEASVIGMADGYAQATRNAAFVNLHSAAGVGNALGNIYTAHRNQTPMVITAGQQARSLLPLQAFLYAERASEFPRPYVKFSVEPARAEDVPAAIARAYYVASDACRAGRPCVGAD